MNMIAYSEHDVPLFAKNCANKIAARTHILNHGMLAFVDYIIYKHKRYTIREVYRWNNAKQINQRKTARY